jgi:hypothetical protein
VDVALLVEAVAFEDQDRSRVRPGEVADLLEQRPVAV